MTTSHDRDSQAVCGDSVFPPSVERLTVELHVGSKPSLSTLQVHLAPHLQPRDCQDRPE